MEPSAPPAPQSSPVVAPLLPKPAQHPLWGVLVGLLAAVVALALAVAALGTIVWVRTEPVPAPSGPDVNVEVSVKVKDSIVDATFQAPGSVETVRVGTMEPSRSWRTTLHFGESVKITVLLVGQGESEETGEQGSASCTVTTGPNDDVLRTATVSAQNGLATCSWTNDGKG